MTIRPHDITDLYLSPVALALDRRLESLSHLTQHQLNVDLAVAMNQTPTDAASRARLSLESLGELIPTHGWTLSWSPRGLRLSHDTHELVLGIPENLRAYLASEAFPTTTLVTDG